MHPGRYLSHALQNLVLRHPRGVLLASGLLVVLAVWLGSGVEFRASQSELAPDDDPDQDRWNELMEDFSGSDALFAAIEAKQGQTASPGELQEFTDRLAARIAADTRIDHTYHRLDLDWLAQRGLYLLPPDSLENWVETIESQAELLEGIAGVDGIAAFNELLAERIEQGRATGSAEQASPDSVSQIAELLRAELTLLRSPGTTADQWTAADPLTLLAGDRAPPHDGYLTTHDGATYFIVISPGVELENLAARTALVSAMRDHAADLLHDSANIHVALTGRTASTVEEMQGIRRDTWKTSAVAVVLVGVLTIFVFRWRSHAMLVMGSLAVGLIWAFGAVKLEYGYLNMITSSFISTLVGVGVAYGIHPVSEYELLGAHTDDPVHAVREAFRRTGAAVMVAGVTTSAAFFSILLMRFRGFAEMGLVAGVGVLLCLAAALFTLPALLAVYGPARKRRRAAMVRGSAAVDRVWVERFAKHVTRFPRAVVSIAALLTVAAGWAAAGWVRMDTNLFDLLPRNAESLTYQRKMVFESDLSPLFNIVIAENLDELAELQRRAASEPSIDRFESVLRLLPTDLPRTQNALDRLRPHVVSLTLSQEAAPADPQAIATSFDRLEEALALSTEDAFVAGLADLVEPLEEARALAEEAAGVARAADEEQVRGWDEAQERLLTELKELVVMTQAAVDADPPTLDNLPDSLSSRFLTRSGKPLGFLFPQGDIFDPDELAEYVDASRRVSDTATGFPLVFSKMVHRIASGLRPAVIVGTLLVLVVLLIDFGRPWEAFLAMIPLGIGAVWMIGLMRLCNIPFNLANLVAVPLIIGVGIDNGVHIVQRMKLEGREGIDVVLRHTGRAILIASLTTMAGFGSLALASHRGLSSLGMVLLLGVGCCLLTSTVVLPNLLLVLGIVRR